MRLLRKLSYPNVVATVALFFALTGAATAGVKYLEWGAPAGGDLAGSLPNPTIAANAVGGAKVADNSLTGADIDESTLGQVPSAASATDAATLNGRSSSDFARASVGGFAVNLPAVAAHSCISKLFDTPAREADDRMIVNPPGNLPNGVVLQPIYSINAGTVAEVRVCNVSDVSVDPLGGYWGYVLIHA